MTRQGADKGEYRRAVHEVVKNEGRTRADQRRLARA
jgi:hypothetical protein